MRFLADAGISPRTVEFLRSLGHDALHVRDIALQRAKDADVLEAARNQHRVLLTFDLDFGQLMAAGVLDRPSVIIFRLADERPDSVNRAPTPVLLQHESSLADGALALIADGRVRIRKLPVRPSLGCSSSAGKS